MFNEIRKELKEKSNKKIADFNIKLCPNINPESVLGIKIPDLRKISKRIILEGNFEKYIEEYNNETTVYLEENIIIGCAIAYSKFDIVEKLKYIKEFVPKIDNWMVNDSFCSTLKLKKEDDLEKLWNFIIPYLKSKNQFEVRFAVIIMLNNFIIDKYVDNVIKEIDKINNNEYYSEMAIAWTLAEIGIKYNEKLMKYLNNENNLDDFTFNKTLQKMIESYRVSKEQKEELKLMKRK